MDNGKPVDRPSAQTVKVRQGTGPHATVSVLLVSLLLAAIAGIMLLFYFLRVADIRAIGPLTIPPSLAGGSRADARGLAHGL